MTKLRTLNSKKFLSLSKPQSTGIPTERYIISFAFLHLHQFLLKSSYCHRTTSTSKPIVWDTFRHLVTLVQFKKREKRTWRSVTFSKVPVFKTVFAQSITLSKRQKHYSNAPYFFKIHENDTKTTSIKVTLLLSPTT